MTGFPFAQQRTTVGRVDLRRPGTRLVMLITIKFWTRHIQMPVRLPLEMPRGGPGCRYEFGWYLELRLAELTKE